MNRPFSLFNIELTNHCVMRCVMCPRTNNMSRPLGFMEFDLYRAAIDELSSCNPDFGANQVLWLHHFGESLLHPEFGSFIRYASSKNIRTGLSVNPIMLRESVIDELLSAGLKILYLSLDGHDDESFQKIRGIEMAYEPSRRRLLDFLARKKTASSTITTILSMIDFDLNRQSIEILRSYWESMPGIDQFLPKSFTTWDGNAPDVNALDSERSATRIDRSRVRCTFPWEQMTITWDGDVVPCCFDYDKKYILGNMRKSSLSEIWNGLPMKLLREEFDSNRVANSLCARCRRLYMPPEDILP
ncbi:MAG: SPASM domain-containing protein [Spirochaetes bacterium]|nr:SPASM domain-containing protein [Spirochaetota bacterium]